MEKERENYDWLLGEINSEIEKVKKWSDPDLVKSKMAALSWVIDKINERRLPTRDEAWEKRNEYICGYLMEYYQISFSEGWRGKDGF